MPFIQNAWYAACWDADLGTSPVSRTILGNPVVIYRAAEKGPVALLDMCPHRFAPLSLGKVKGDHLQCPYHGLLFNAAGTCVANPNGKGLTPKALSVRHFPTHVQDGMIWIWPGDPERAQDTIPPRYDFLDDPSASTVRGYLHVDAHYELVTDNLLDLSHAEFLHPFIAGPGDYEGTEIRTEQTGEAIIAYHSMPGHSVTPMFKPFLDESVSVMDGRAHMHWEAPANMMLDVGATHLKDDGEREDIPLPNIHLLTPESESGTHYFWAISRTRFTDSEEMDKFLKEGLTYAFQNEDEPMVRAVAERMKGKALFELNPALLPQDEAAVRARRIVAKRVELEQQSRRETAA